MKRLLLAFFCLSFVAYSHAEPFKIDQLDPLSLDEQHIINSDSNQKNYIKLNPLIPGEKGSLFYDSTRDKTGIIRENPLQTEDYHIFTNEGEQTEMKKDNVLRKDKKIIEINE